MPVKVNGRVITSGNPRTYVTLERQWQDGDLISFTLPASFRITKYDGIEKYYSDADHYAIEYGPVLKAWVNLKGEKEKFSLNADIIADFNFEVSTGKSNFKYSRFFSA